MYIMKHSQASKGFTLVELMVTVGLLAFFGFAAATNFFDVKAWFGNYRLKAASRTIQMDFQFAKMEAIKSNAYCTITFNQPIAGVTYDYVVYTDNNNNLDFDAGDTVLRQFRFADYDGITFDTGLGSVSFLNNDAGLPSIAFDPKGLPRTNSGGFGAGSVFLKNDSGKKSRVVVSNVGRIRIP
jgi:prepilin-type N-terminal cleavage/methylation domain-containing protein